MNYNHLVVFLISFLLSVILTPIIRYFVINNNLLARPKEDRWHKAPTAILGGAAIFIASIVPILIFVPLNKNIIGFLIGGSFIFVWGLFDDLKDLPPHSKLLGQIIACCIAVFSGVIFNVTPVYLLSIPLTIIWIIGITNSFNLLDNMDGLSAGIAAISAFMIFLSSIVFKSDGVGIIALILVGAALGFLPYNFHPANIFMGDCGSMFLGFSLATLSIIGTYRHLSNLLVTLIIPVLILAIPIFDTAFVMLIRRIQGKTIFKGGRDHTSHRLVSLGLSERKTVLLLYLLSILFGLIALLYSKIDLVIVSIFTVLTLIVLFFFGIFLAEVNTYEPDEIEEIKKKKLRDGKVIINTILLHKRRIVEVLVDLILILVSHYSAYLLRFEGKISSANLSLINYSLPWIIIIKMMAFFYFGLYRGVWRYVGLNDLISVFKAVTISSTVSILVLTFLFRFQDYSRVVFIIDWLLTLFLISGVRILIRVLYEYFASLGLREKKILIMGAGDTGEMVLREIKRNKKLNYKPVGFIDDNIEKVGRRIHGVPILGTRHDMYNIVNTQGIEEVFIAVPSTKRQNLDEVIDICKNCNVSYREIDSILGFNKNDDK